MLHHCIPLISFDPTIIHVNVCLYKICFYSDETQADPHYYKYNYGKRYRYGYRKGGRYYYDR